MAYRHVLEISFERKLLTPFIKNSDNNDDDDAIKSGNKDRGLNTSCL